MMRGSATNSRPGASAPRDFAAFTLVELLVVIAVIAILASLLLPALASAKSKALSTACQSNLKQLQLCWHGYTHDFNDGLPPNNYVYELSTGQPIENVSLADTWCLGNARTDITTSNIEHGLLFPYNRSVAIYRCPADKSRVEGNFDAPPPRTRSYNMSQSVNGNPTLPSIPSFSKHSRIIDPSPSKLFVFLDVHEDEIIDSLFGIPTAGPGWVQDCWWDLPADRHNRGCNFSFADGHIERWRWVAPKVYHKKLPQPVGPAEWPDYWRVQAGVKQKLN